jgi:hypothetical protein
MCNSFQFESKSVAVVLVNDGLMSTNASLVLIRGLLDTGQVSWLMCMNAALVLVNDAFVRRSDALVRMHASFMLTKKSMEAGSPQVKADESEAHLLIEKALRRTWYSGAEALSFWMAERHE